MISDHELETMARAWAKSMMSPTPHSLGRILREAVNGANPFTGALNEFPVSSDRAVEIAARVLGQAQAA